MSCLQVSSWALNHSQKNAMFLPGNSLRPDDARLLPNKYCSLWPLQLMWLITGVEDLCAPQGRGEQMHWEARRWLCCWHRTWAHPSDRLPRPLPPCSLLSGSCKAQAAGRLGRPGRSLPGADDRGSRGG